MEGDRQSIRRFSCLLERLVSPWTSGRAPSCQLMVEAEEGLAAALIWDIGQELALPSVRREALAEERADGLTRLSRL